MKILVIGGYAPSLLNFRGPLLRNLVSRGHEVVACAPNASSTIIAGLAKIGVRYRHIPLSRAGLNPAADLQTLACVRRVFQVEQPVRVLAYTAKPIIYACLAAGSVGQPMVHCMITGLGYGFGNSTARQRIVGWVMRNLYRRGLKHSAGVIFQNPDDGELFSSLGLVPEYVPVTMINGSGVDLDWYSPQPLPEDPVFLLIARLLADKGIREYVEAARKVRQRHPNARFQLAGGLDPNPSSIGSDELRRWHGEGAIEYLGELEDVRSAYAGARVYVLPSYREGTPRTVLEAMATGRPIITTDAPGCRETVVDGVNGLLVPPRDSEALARAMIELIERPQEEIQSMADASLGIARKKYDVNLVNQQLMEFMEL